MSETSPQQNLETADFVVIGVYFVLILAVGIWVRLSPYIVILSALIYSLIALITKSVTNFKRSLNRKRIIIHFKYKLETFL